MSKALNWNFKSETSKRLGGPDFQRKRKKKEEKQSKKNKKSCENTRYPSTLRHVHAHLLSLYLTAR
jgi:hypothetical protein